MDERAFDPAIRVLPVARQRAPQHDGGTRLREMIEHRPREQPLVEIAALAVRPEQAVRVQERADRILRAVELRIRRLRRHQPERQRVAPGVIADPVPLGMRAFGERAVLARAFRR